MRIACVHIPQFALQCVTRLDPSLRGAPVVVVGSSIPRGQLDPAGGGIGRGAPHTPIVHACSRAAWALGVRVGMTATMARGLSPDLHVVAADPQLERDTTRALADVLLGASAVVDVGGRVGPGGAHLAMYAEVPAKTRGTSFGERLLERLAALGLTGRIGIADDRFTAWVAAWHGVAHGAGHGAGDGMAHDRASRHAAPAERLGDDPGVISVPRGGSAAFLAPRPLALLAISPEVLHMLEALGVRTLGEFAALPAPSVARPFEADYQALARGEGGNALRPYTPDAPIREEAAIGSGPHALSGPAAIALLAERVALRLQGRGRSAARLEVTVVGADGERPVPITPMRASEPGAIASGLLSSAEVIAEAIGAAVGDAVHARVPASSTPAGPPAAAAPPAARLRVVVSGEALAGDPVDASVELPVQRGLAAVPAAALDERTQVLAVVLSTTGGAAERFGLTSPIADRRDLHRRTRRGKQRRRTRTGEVLAQPRLFKM